MHEFDTDPTHQPCLSIPGNPTLPGSHHFRPVKGVQTCEFCGRTDTEIREAVETYEVHFARLMDPTTSKEDREYARAITSAMRKVMQGEKR